MLAELPVMRAAAAAAAAAAMVVVLALGCTVTRRTPGLACQTTNDCKNGGTCQSNYCVGESICPKQCTSCDENVSPPTCTITVTFGHSPVDCPADHECMISCTGTDACGDITCSNEQCTVDCNGTTACGTVDCGNSCGCQVTCTGTNACGANTCPTGRMGAACVSGTTCTTSGTGCNSC